MWWLLLFWLGIGTGRFLLEFPSIPLDNPPLRLYISRKRFHSIFRKRLAMSASLREVADRVGVSLATASRALNGKGGVKPETRQRVLEVAQELQFSFSMAARGLVTTKTETICYVVHQRHAPF